jgi:hypothetical protein
MGTIFKASVIASAMSLGFITQAAADSFWYCPPVPEFDGSSSVAVIALLMSVGAILIRRARG